MFTATEVGTAITMVTANDVDISPAVTYDFSVDGNPDRMFSIDRFSGIIRLAKPLDHEQRNHYTVGLQVNIDIRTLVKSALRKFNFLISQPKYMLWVLKRTVSMRRFF